jgi:threonine dehydratase
MVTYTDILEAQKRISSLVERTPILTSSTIDKMTDSAVFFKCENLQRVGAFKFRGALNAVYQLSNEQRAAGVVAHSSGNHAQALALAASLLDVKSTIIMPKNSPAVKVNATRGYGAEIIFCENTVNSRVETAERIVKERGSVLIHPYDNDHIIAGAGTAALELLQEVQDLDVIIAPVGGGGLLSGSSIAAKGFNPDIRVLAGEPSGADDAFRSLRDGTIYPSVDPQTIADGLRTNLSERTFSIIRDNVERIILVTDVEIVRAMRLHWERMKLVVEPSGAVPLAALLKERDSLAGAKIGVIISGGNVDLDPFFSQYKGLHVKCYL